MVSSSAPSVFIKILSIAFFGHLCGLLRANRDAVLVDVDYEEFRSIHRSGEAQGDDYSKRMSLFQARKAEVDAHNARKDVSWTTAVNQFSDYHQHEMDAMLGYKRTGGRWAEAAQASSFLQTAPMALIDVKSLAKAKDWRTIMNFSNFVHNQGGCGSCWAHAAIAALEAHAELATGLATKLSTQEVIDCTANPRKCGGTGGCHGATSEMAFEYARQYGLPQLDAYKEGGCAASSSSPAARVLQINSFVRLPENKASYLLHALATKGPVVLSVDASSLFSYKKGVFHGCQPDTVVNHAVLGVGYGYDQASKKDYWTIKNSWGGSWGEDGYLRVQRHAQDTDYCGTDNKPQDGVYCEKHPDTIQVCGMCGVTSDSAYPVITTKKALRQHIAPHTVVAAPLTYADVVRARL